jgi:hypothetical protein
MIGIALNKSVANSYTSPYGWSMDLPEGWSKLPNASSNPLAPGFRPELFGCDDDWYLSIAWTRIRVSSYRGMEQFMQLAATPGPIPVSDADAVVSQLVPLVGTTTKAEALYTPSGHRAVEIIKLCEGSKSLPPRMGIDLIVDPDLSSTYIDRVSFYAEAAVFPEWLPTIKAALWSLRFPDARAVKTA